MRVVISSLKLPQCKQAITLDIYIFFWIFIKLKRWLQEGTMLHHFYNEAGIFWVVIRKNLIDEEDRKKELKQSL